MGYTRRGFKGGTRQTTLVGDISDAVTTITGSDFSTWTGVTDNGPAAATINQGESDEETITFTGISGNNLTGVTRGEAGTTEQAHTSGAKIDHTSSVTDFDEANAHIADTTLDHHTQYAKTDGSRTITGGVSIVPTTTNVVGLSLNVPAGQTSDLVQYLVNSAVKYKVTTTGAVQATGVTSGFGRGATGGGGQYVELSEDGINTFVKAKGTTTDVALVLRPLGTSSVSLQTPGGSVGVAVKDAGAGVLVGFYGTTPVAKPTATGSRGGNAALASLLTALANLGLLVDSTSA